MRDGWLIPFQSTPHRALRTPAKMAENLPDMSGVILDPRLFLDERSDPADGPKRGGIAVSLRTGPQRGVDLFVLVVGAAGEAVRPVRLCAGPPFRRCYERHPSGRPTADELPGDVLLRPDESLRPGASLRPNVFFPGLRNRA